MTVNTIQRPGNCPQCGYWDPFHGSWYSPDKEVADPKWAEEWDLEILQLCKDYPNGITVEHADGDWWYHLTRANKTLERFPLALLKVGLSPAERVGQTWRQKR
jgi:hypothetical protein